MQPKNIAIGFGVAVIIALILLYLSQNAGYFKAQVGTKVPTVPMEGDISDPRNNVRPVDAVCGDNLCEPPENVESCGPDCASDSDPFGERGEDGFIYKYGLNERGDYILYIWIPNFGWRPTPYDIWPLPRVQPTPSPKAYVPRSPIPSPPPGYKK